MTVQLKVNMILEKGAYLPMGALVEEEMIPPNLRKRKYVVPVLPGEEAPSEISGIPTTTMLAQPEQDEDDGGDEPLDNGGGDEPPSPPPPVSMRKR